MTPIQTVYVAASVVTAGLLGWVIWVLRFAPPLVNTTGPAPQEAPSDPPPAPSEPKARAEAMPEATTPKGVTEPPPASEHFDDEEPPTLPQALFLVNAVGHTDPGLKRKNNEDAYAVLANHQLFVIADGMGRHAAGEVASMLCVDAIEEAFQSGNFGVLDTKIPKRGARLKAAIERANERIFHEAEKNEAYFGMGTTVVGAYFAPNNERVYVAHVGDSRAYRLRDGKLEQLTQDHAVSGAVRGGMLTRAVGVEEAVDVDLRTEIPKPGDYYLLCSDGLTRMVDEKTIIATLSEKKDLETLTKRLIALANERGGKDNITAIVVRVDESV